MDMLRIVSTRPALPGPAPRLLPPAGADLLGLRVPDPPGDRAGLGVPEPAAGADPGRPDRGTGLGRDQGGARGPQRRARTSEGKPASRGWTSPRSRSTRRPEAEARTRLKTGKTPLVIEPLGSESWAYHYDPTRPEAAAARQIDRRHPAAGRGPHQPAVDQGRLRHRARLTLHRLPDPRPDRAQRHGGRALGHRLPAGQLPDRQAAQAVRGHADAPARLPAGPPGGPA